MSPSHRLLRLGVIAGIAFCLSACATSSHDPLPSLSGSVAPLNLFPPAYLRPSANPSNDLDPKLVQEIQAFMEKSGILFEMPTEMASEIPIILNKPVQFYVRHFSQDKKAIFGKYLSRSGRYLVRMRQILQEHGLPPDLVYLVLVESGFNPYARSPAEAVGPWQFIEGTARRYGLKVNDFVDERRDPEKSTHAAARYLKDLYQQFGCWNLAAAGYNAGEKRVEKSMVRLGSRDFWLMAKNGHLPEETCNFVPQFIAAALIARNPQRYGFEEITYQRPHRYDRVQVPGGTDLRWFADLLGISYEELQEINPELKQSKIPSDQTQYTLKVPINQRGQAKRLTILCWKKQGLGHSSPDEELKKRKGN